LGDQLEVVTLQGNLVLLSSLNALNAVGHDHAADVLLPQEVANLHSLAVVLNGNVDGEMGVDRFHLVAVAIGDAFHHVLNVTNDSSHSSDVFTVAEPLLHLNPLFAEHLDVQLGVLKGLTEESTLALDGDDAVVDRRRDILGDLHLQARVNGLHLLCFKSSAVSD